MTRNLPSHGPEESKTYLEVQVAPDYKHVSSGLWGRFINFLRDTFSSREFREMADSVGDAAIDAGFEELRRGRVRNENFEAQTKRELAAVAKTGFLLEAEKRHLEAETNLLEEQAMSEKTKRLLEVISECREQGFDVRPVFNSGGELDGLYFQDESTSPVPRESK